MDMSDRDKEILEGAEELKSEVPGYDAMAEFQRKQNEAIRARAAEQQKVTGEIRPTTQSSQERNDASNQRAKEAYQKGNY